MIFSCIFPCRKTFQSEQRLRQHYKNRPECRSNWKQREERLTQAAFKRHRIRASGPDPQTPLQLPISPQNHSSHAGNIENSAGPQQQVLYHSSGAAEIEDIEQPEEEQLYFDDLQIIDDLQIDESMPSLDAPAQLIPSQADKGQEEPTPDSSTSPDFERWYFELERAMDGTAQGDENPLNDDNLDPEDNGDMDDSDEGETEVDHPDDGDLDATLGNLRKHPGLTPCVEDNDEDDPPTINVFPQAGEVKATGQSRFSELERAQRALNANTVYYPFADSAEFSLVKWLNDLPLSKIDSFIQLEFARQRIMSFASGQGMRDMIGRLPNPRVMWKHVEVIPESGTTADPVFLCYRDPIAAVRSLLDRPALQDHLTFTPVRKWSDRDSGKRCYDEIFTGDWAWETQESLPQGSTLIPVLLGSDKAHLTQFSGTKSAWPLYLSIGNIHSSVRNKPTMKCWVLIAYIPCPLFITPKTKLQTAFVARLFHQCLAIILKPLKEAGENGRHLRDSHGDRRHCFLRVAAYLGDYPEQAMINVAAANNSPVTIAGHKDLGNSKPSPRRTREYILEHIARVTSMVDQSDIGAYIDQAKAFGLNAVNRPFWAELPGYEPDLVMAPDILHGLHRFWRDHPLRWVRNLMGVAQLDARLKALQPVVGYRHFSNGISHLSQWSGREDRELQRYLVAAVSGSPRLDSDSLFCLRRLHDFIYIAQYRTHSTKTLQLLDEALKDFHRFKNCFIRNGARRGSSKVVMNHFRIPKLAGLHMFSYHIPRMGSSMQFSTEIIETSHIQAAKLAFKATNRKNFVAQMCAYGDRLATLSLMEDLGAWIYEHAQARHLQHRLNRTTPPYNAFAMQALSLQQQDQPEEVHVATRALRGHIWHTVKPDIKGILVRTLTKDYALPGAFEIIAKYLESQGISSYEARNFTTLDVWYRCRIQLPLAGDDASGVAESRTLQAVPPFITKTRFGLCNCGLVKLDETAGRNGIKGYRVAQVRIIFKARVARGHRLKDVPLAYVYWFHETRREADDNVEMYSVEYIRYPDNRRVGSVIPLASICRQVQLVPCYGAQVHPTLNSNNSMDAWRRYYINSFFDKECYQAVW